MSKRKHWATAVAELLLPSLQGTTGSRQRYTSAQRILAAALCDARAMGPEVKQLPSKASRPVRWGHWLAAARSAYDDLQAALSELNDLSSEYEDWYGNLPESLQQSALGEKLEAVTQLDFEGATSDIETLLDKADGIDLPLGHGRD